MAKSKDKDKNDTKSVGLAEVGFGAGAGLATGAAIATANAKVVMEAHSINTALEVGKDLAKSEAFANVAREGMHSVPGAASEVMHTVGELLRAAPQQRAAIVEDLGVRLGEHGAEAAGRVEQFIPDAVKAVQNAGKKLMNLWSDLSVVRKDPIMRPLVVFKNMSLSGKVGVGLIGAGVGTGVGYVVNQLRNRDASPKINLTVNVPPASYQDKLAQEPQATLEKK